MTHKALFTWAVVLSLVCMAAVRVPPRRPAPRGVADRSWREDPRWAADLAVKIEWVGDWDATYSINRQRWLTELANDRLRDARMNVRLIALQEALMAKYPELADRHAEAYRDIAGRLRAMNFHASANEYYRRSIAAAPGRVDLALLSLTSLLKGGDAVSAEHAEYAARRVLALHRTGHLGESDPLVTEAWYVLARALRLQGQFMEAADALENYQRWGGVPVAATGEEANLYDDAGHVDEAILRLQSLAVDHDERGIRERISRLSEGQALSPGRFAGDESANVRWSVMRLRPPKDLAAEVLPLLEEDPDGRNIVAWEDVRFTSLWCAMDRLVRGMPPALVRPLREAHDQRARAVLTQPHQHGAGDLLRIFRRYPWSNTAAAGLLEAGDQFLRRGHTSLARRCFQDVLSHADDADLRRRAEKGLKLAADAPPAPGDAAGRPVASVQPAVATVGFPAAGGWPDEVLRRVPDEFVPALRWTGPSLHEAGGRLLAASPNLLACYRAWPPALLWQQTPQMSPSAQGRLGRAVAAHFAMPGPCRPAVGGGMVYHRWGLDASGEFATAIAAFDQETGRLVWSTADNPALSGLWPAADPTYCEGRVYYPALAHRQGAGSSAAMSVVCVSAADGSVVFVRGLAELSPSLPIHSEERRRGRMGQFPRADLAHYGNALTVFDGEIYCLTSMGVAAKLDARDGVVEWAITYPRAMLRRDSLPVLRRQGCAPIVAGNLVIFAPRDRYGLLAVDRQTAQTAWDAPFAYSRDVAGLAGGVLVVCDDYRLAGIDAASGTTVWMRHLADAVESPPRMTGEAVHVNLGDRLVVLDGRSGRVLREQVWGGTEPVRDFAVMDGGLAVATDRSPGGAAGASSRAGEAAAGARDERLAYRWHVPMVNPRLIRPPAGGPLRGMLYIVGADGFACINPAADNPVAWRRWAAPGIDRVHFAGDALVLLYPNRADCIDARTGELLWHVRLPVVFDEAATSDDLLVVAAAGENRPLEVAAFDIASGAMLWHRRGTGITTVERMADLATIVIDRDNVHVAGRPMHNGPLAQVIYRSGDGTVIGGGRLPAGRNPRRVAFDGVQGCAVTETGAVHWFSLAQSADPTGEQPAGSLPPGTVPEAEMIAVAMRGEWTTVNTFRNYGHQRSISIYRRGDPGYRLTLAAEGRIIGDRLYDANGRTLTIVDLPTKRTAAQCVVPVMESLDHHTEILDFWEEAGEVAVVSGLERGFSAATKVPGDVRIDIFDAASGNHRCGQVLRPGGYWKAFYESPGRTPEVVHRTQAARVGPLVLVTAGDGVHAYAPARPPAPGDAVPAAARANLCYRAAAGRTEPPAADGWAMECAPGHQAALRAWHDDETLCIEVRYRDDRVESWRGEPFRSGGDWLELGLTTNVGSWRFGAGVADDGRTILRNIGATPLPTGCRAGIWHDLPAQQHIYRVWIPLKRAVYRDPTGQWRDVGLSAAVWEAVEAGPPARVAVFGRALRSAQLEAAAHERVRLYELSPEGEKAALAIADALPVLDESLGWIEQAAMARSASPAAVADFYRAYLGRHRAGPHTDRALLSLDAFLRRRVEDPVPAVLKIAAEAGVSAAAQKRYETIARAYISQWVLTDAANPPRMLLMQFSDGRTWEHRISWGQYQAIWTGLANTPSRRIVGTMPSPGSWQELRIPLVWLDLHDKPICGVSFGQLGGARTFWDRTALVIGGKENVFVEDDTPAGKVGGFWDWVEEPRKSGKRSRTYADPASANDAAWHDVAAMQRPVTDHLLPPSAAPPPSPGAAAATEILRKHMPDLGPTNTAVAFLGAMVRMQQTPEQKLDCYRWFLRTLPAHPRTPEMIASAHELLRSAGADDALARVEAMLEELKVPPRAAYTWRRQYVYTQRAFLTEWQVLGPFPNPDDTGLEYPYPPELQRIRLDADYRGIPGAIKWKPYKSNRDFVDLASVLSPNEHAVAYAVCWVRSEKGRPVTIEFGSDDGGRIWVNRRLVHSAHEHDYAQRGDHRIAAYLAAGWNEILVKVDQGTDDWGFYMELVDPQGRGPLTDVTVSATPPG